MFIIQNFSAGTEVQPEVTQLLVENLVNATYKQNLLDPIRTKMLLNTLRLLYIKNIMTLTRKTQYSFNFNLQSQTASTEIWYFFIKVKQIKIEHM